jgi:tripartite-type tricarboxylate transporter receptor subunit TctC
MKTIVRVWTLSAALLLSGALHAQNAPSNVVTPYPMRPVRIIVPFAPGGPSDALARILAQKLTDNLGKTFYVENHAGVGGNVGMGLAANSPADGYTFLVVSSSFVVNPSLYTQVPYDPFKSFTPITLAAASPQVLMVHPSVPARTVQELVALVRSNPGKHSIASPGTGTTGHLACEMFRLSLNLDLVHVPFNGAGPLITSTIGGHTTIAISALPPAAPHIKSGTLRALAVTSAKRSPAFPDVPTLAETGIPDQESDVIQGFLAPAGTPKEIIDLLHREIVKIIALPDVQERFVALGFNPVANTPTEFAALIKLEVAKWGKIVREAKIKAE